jgi:F-type H+-transporting ATPase subunit delta
MSTEKQDRVAKRYARALFEVCPPAEFDPTKEQLKLLAKAWTNSQEFRENMLNPSVQDGARLKVLQSVVDALNVATGRSGWPNQATQRAVETLVTQRKTAALPALAESFSQLVNEYRKSLTLAVNVARPVTADTLSDVKAKLSQALGGEVTIVVNHDPTLLGGMTIRLGDMLLDRSVAGTIQRIAAQLA